MASKACAHERVGLAVDGKRVLRCTGNMVIPSTLCPDCDKWVPQVEVERIRTMNDKWVPQKRMRDVEQERLDERYAVKAESDFSFTLGAALILMIVLGAALAVLL